MKNPATGIVRHIPNFITSLNVFCGTSAIVFAFQGDLIFASILVLLAAVFDFFDGMAARILHAYSEIGKQLDSLADVISFGVAPSSIIYNMLLFSQEIKSIKFIHENPNVLLLVFVITIFSALRLAKFNVDTRQTNSFIGLPTPANAIFWVSFPLINMTSSQFLGMNEILSNPYIIFSLIIIMSYLLVAEIPMFSLKFKNLKLRDNFIRYIFLLTAVVLFIFLGIFSIPLTILVYILVSIINNLKK